MGVLESVNLQQLRLVPQIVICVIKCNFGINSDCCIQIRNAHIFSSKWYKFNLKRITDVLVSESQRF